MTRKTLQTRSAGEKESANPVDAYVGMRLKERRQSLDISQSTLGELLGVTFQQVQKYERGSNRISASRLYHLSELLEVPVAYFFDGYNGKKAEKTKKTAKKMVDYTWLEGPDDDLMTRKETIELVNAYYNVRDSNVRRQFVKVMAAMAKAQ